MTTNTTVTKPSIVYSSEQQAAIDKIVNFAEHGHGEIRLVGSAGVGKTTVLQEIIKQIAALAIPITIICPTHKAKTVAQKAINRDRDPNDLLANFYEPITLAKALGNIPTIKVEDGKKVFAQKGKALKMGGFLVVDEASMLSEYSRDKLLELVEDTATILYVLDPVQLPAIKSKSDVPCIYELKMAEALLTTPQRFYAQSTIGTITTQLRKKDPRLTNFNWSGLATYCKDKPDVNIYSNEDKFEEAFLISMENHDWTNNPDSVRFLSYTNKQVDKYNSLVARLHFDNDTPNYIATEVLIAKSPFIRTDPNSTPDEIFTAAAKDTIHYLNNGSEFSLLDRIDTGSFIHPKYQNKPVEYFVWSAKNDEGEIFTTNIVSRKGQRNFNHIKADLNKAALAISDKQKKKKAKAWKNMYKFINSFDDCKRAYALTVHSSQGQTISNVFVDMSFLEVKIAERLYRALTYTAYTRASDSLHIYIPPHYVSRALVDTIR